MDEIIARFVQPMASFARDLINHKYYQDCEDKKVSVVVHFNLDLCFSDSVL